MWMSSYMGMTECLLLQDVAIKVFAKQEYSEDALISFRQEVVIFCTRSCIPPPGSI